MKIRIRIVAVLLVAIMSFMLTGCDLFSRNTSDYLNQTVITISYNDGDKKGTVINVTRREYINAYNNYGNLSSSGLTENALKESAIKALVNRKILLEEAKGKESIVQRVNERKTEVLYQTYKALISNANDYEEQIKKDWNIKTPNSMEEESSSGTVYKPYEKTAELVYVNNQYKIKKIETQSSEIHDRTFNSTAEVKQAFQQETKNNETDAVAREKYVRYLAGLRATQAALGTKYTDEKLVDEEIERIYNNLLDNEYITQYENLYLDNDGYSSISIEQVLNKYKAMISVSNFKYKNNQLTYATDMLENFKDVDYYINDDYFYVAHILIKFSDEEQTIYDGLDEQSNNGEGALISGQVYLQAKQNLYNNLKATVTDTETGEVLSEHTVPAEDVLQEVRTAVESATSPEQKDEAFRELMYKYNEDGGIMNADYPYIIGINDSKMVENFTNASRELNEAGVYGGLSGLVESQYGLHIIYYMGKCKNVFEFGTNGQVNIQAYKYDEEDNIIGSDIIALYETKLNNLNNKTLFDLVYEELYSDNLSKYENVNLETLNQYYKISVEKFGI